MTVTVGIRREDKHRFERRVPLTPDAVGRLTERHGLGFVVQPSTIRVFGDDAYRAVGAAVDEDLSGCGAVLAVKEIPIELLGPDTCYVFFSHTIKGQPHNMPLLRRLMELRCTLVDYERIVDDEGRRLVFFGRHAGLAGMIDTLSVLGRRLATRGIETPFVDLGLSHEYDSLDHAKERVKAIGARLRSESMPAALRPFVVGFTGYGNVSQGAQEIYDLLGVETIEPDQLAAIGDDSTRVDRPIKVVFRESDLVEPNDPAKAFDLQEYYDHPDRFRSTFERHVEHLSVLINAIYWTEDYPRLLTHEFLREWYGRDGEPRLQIVGDISCDLDGSVQCTVKATTPDRPAYVYDPMTGAITDGVEGEGLCMMTTDCLPCELPREASESFTAALEPFVSAIASIDRSATFDAAALPSPIRSATVVWNGELTPEYRYLAEHIGE